MCYAHGSVHADTPGAGSIKPPALRKVRAKVDLYQGKDEWQTINAWECFPFHWCYEHKAWFTISSSDFQIGKSPIYKYGQQQAHIQYWLHTNLHGVTNRKTEILLVPILYVVSRDLCSVYAEYWWCKHRHSMPPASCNHTSILPVVFYKIYNVLTVTLLTFPIHLAAGSQTRSRTVKNA